MDFKNLVERSWHHTLAFLGPVLLLTFVLVLVAVASVGILAPVALAGYVQSLLRAVREGRPPEVGDLFSQMRLFLPLSGFCLLAVIAVSLGFALLVLPGLVVAALVAFSSLYLIPLMTDGGYGLLDGLRKSWEMAMEPPVTDHIIVTIICVALASLGSALPFAFLITQPLATFFLIEVYRLRTAEAGRKSNARMSAEDAPPPPPPPHPY